MMKTFKIIKTIDGGKDYPNTTITLDKFYPELSTGDKLVCVSEIKEKLMEHQLCNKMHRIPASKDYYYEATCLKVIFDELSRSVSGEDKNESTTL